LRTPPDDARIRKIGCNRERGQGSNPRTGKDAHCYETPSGRDGKRIPDGKEEGGIWVNLGEVCPRGRRGGVSGSKQTGAKIHAASGLEKFQNEPTKGRLKDLKLVGKSDDSGR